MRASTSGRWLVPARREPAADAGPRINCGAVNTRREHGYILTRHWRDTRDGSEIELWVATDAGVRRIVITGQRSVAFAPADAEDRIKALIGDDRAVELASLPLKTFGQIPVIGVYTRGYRVMLNLEKRLADAGIELFEADIRPDDRYLMERFITAAIVIESEDANSGTLLNPRLRPGEGYRPSLRIVSLDIETSARGELYSIALEGCGQRQVFMLGSAVDTGSVADDFQLAYFDDRSQMIIALNNWFRHHDPDAIIGWNLIQFDLRLLQACADKCALALTLGRGGA
ncbi:MAG TPA: 3'-5' exonuclease, partial [Luteibacter sp.]|nr:3'-5' exonuclease [Luteibacter sp.]